MLDIRGGTVGNTVYKQEGHAIIHICLQRNLMMTGTPSNEPVSRKMTTMVPSWEPMQARM